MQRSSQKANSSSGNPHSSQHRSEIFISSPIHGSSCHRYSGFGRKHPRHELSRHFRSSAAGEPSSWNIKRRKPVPAQPTLHIIHSTQAMRRRASVINAFAMIAAASARNQRGTGSVPHCGHGPCTGYRHPCAARVRFRGFPPNPVKAGKQSACYVCEKALLEYLVVITGYRPIPSFPDRCEGPASSGSHPDKTELIADAARSR